MNWVRNLLRVILFLIMLISLQAFADDPQEIKQLIHGLYVQNLRGLLCRNADELQDKKLIKVPSQYFSNDFMKYYGENCKDQSEHWEMYFDPRTGQNDLSSLHSAVSGEYDSQEIFTNLKIGQPKITGNKATIRTTYDLPVATYQEYGNFTLFTMIKENGQWKIDDIELGGHDMDKYNERESMTALKTYKSVKQYIKKSLMEIAAKQHKSPKKTP